MLYMNDNLQISTREFADKVTGKPFKVNQVCLGTPRPSEQIIVLTVPKTVTEVKQGMNSNLTIGYTESFRPRIHEAQNEDVYLLLTSKGSNEVGVNTIQVPATLKSTVHVLRRGFGYNSCNRGLLRWDTALFRFTTKTGLVRIHTDDDNEDQILVITGGQVTRCTEKTLKSVCRFKRITPPKAWVKL